MLENFKDHIQKKLEELKIKSALAVDTSQFNDPLAETVEWHALKPGGANFKTHVLKKNGSLYQYKPSLGALLFCGIFVVVGLLILLAGLGIIFTDEKRTLLVIFGSIFTFAGIFFYRHSSIKVNFDTMHGYIWLGSDKPQLTGNPQDKNTAIYFSEVHAVQIISERIKSDNNYYHSHEINLILRDQSRFNVIDHGHHESIIKDAKLIAQFLNKPLWDASVKKKKSRKK